MNVAQQDFSVFLNPAMPALTQAMERFDQLPAAPHPISGRLAMLLVEDIALHPNVSDQTMIGVLVRSIGEIRT